MAIRMNLVHKVKEIWLRSGVLVAIGLDQDMLIALAPPWPWRCKFDPRTDHSKGAIHLHNCPLQRGLLTLDLELLTAICNKSTDGVALCWRKRLLTENGQMLLEACQFFTRFRQTRSKIKNDK